MRFEDLEIGDWFFINDPNNTYQKIHPKMRTLDGIVNAISSNGDYLFIISWEQVTKIQVTKNGKG